MQLYSSASDCTLVGNISGSKWKPFQLYYCILNDVISITEAPPF